MPKTAKETTPARSDGRRAFLVYMDPEIIRNLKMAALDEDRNAYEIVEETVAQWLASRGRKRKTKS